MQAYFFFFFFFFLMLQICTAQIKQSRRLHNTYARARGLMFLSAPPRRTGRVEYTFFFFSLSCCCARKQAKLELPCAMRKEENSLGFLQRVIFTQELSSGLVGPGTARRQGWGGGQYPRSSPGDTCRRTPKCKMSYFF
ncbi:hypothetical protein FN846DRAFT_929710 [Sphaerosporella brunnea]|uniref:Secreted protein n=1 Tax=Sphaerosporella brunnea TaxID=1250544 RepID=A0A5J5F8Z0_9PEZI|nr:hypothetical protein FN846DRAFT_929710 [Sphaerosporella brunnea]